MTRYTLHIPSNYNDGREVSPTLIRAVEEEILSFADGYTLTLGVGAWKNADGEVYREPVRLYAVDTEDGSALIELAEWVADALGQEAVYLTAAEIAPTLIRQAVAA